MTPFIILPNNPRNPPPDGFGPLGFGPPGFGPLPGRGSNAAAIARGFAIKSLVNPEAIAPIVLLISENPALIANNPPTAIPTFLRILNRISLNNFVLPSSDAFIA